MPDQKPVNVSTRETVQFIATNLPRPATVLEIGCGSGDVAAELQRLGYIVTAVDSDTEEVEVARSRGVAAIAGQWPHVLAPRADAVVFTRSLHHLKDLTGALRAAHRTLVGPRRLLIEDFDFSSADQATARWLVVKVHEAAVQGLLRRDATEFAMRVTGAPDPFAAWQADHDHDLHRAEDILAAVMESFVVDHRAEVAYAFRYLVPVVSETSAAAEWLRTVLDDERRRGLSGDLKLIGRRIAATAA